MTTHWFTSDLHFGHQKVAGIRGFDSTDDHDSAVAASIFDAMAADDVLWILGDLSSGSTSGDRAAADRISVLAQTFLLHLISGNHDSSHPLHRRSHLTTYDRPYRCFDSVQQSASRKINGHRVLLSHFPYSGAGSDHGAERYTQWRFPDLGAPLIHGHTHLPDQRVHYSDAGTWQLHVGWDAWRRPVSINEIVGLLPQRSAS